MIPYKHYVPVKGTLSDLIPKISWLNEDEVAYKRIVGETEKFARKYLSKDFALEQLFKTILEHGVVKNFRQ
ncbi:glycosyl transferase family 90 [Alkalihalobacillus sp. AL-G]|uniref:glycosyl transferase family 90 n=1 Tax=Alkalihalobacillus sp. AL-G TaxID=2926399 RepID=UPI00351B3FB1